MLSAFETPENTPSILGKGAALNKQTTWQLTSAELSAASPSILDFTPIILKSDPQAMQLTSAVLLQCALGY